MIYQPHQLGQQAEKAAARALKKSGLKLIEKNFRGKMGEIDLIMQDKEELVFVEVRLRNHQDYASALESVDYKKQQKLIKTAQFYLQKHQLADTVPCRFDVVAIAFLADKTSFDWIKNAF